MDRNKSLMSRLLEAGFSLDDELDHHYSDLYVVVTPLSTTIIQKWADDNGWRADALVTVFNDNVTGRKMYDIPFQYDPFWTFEVEKTKPVPKKKAVISRKSVVFPMYVQAVGYKKVQLPPDVDAGDEDAVRDYIASIFDELEVPEDLEWVGDDGFDWESPISIVDDDEDDL